MRKSAAVFAAVLAISLLLTPSVSRAESTSLFSLPSGSVLSRQSPASNGGKDSLMNGALIGAVVGATALGGFGLCLCHALDDTGGQPDCFPQLLGIAALGAGIGLGAGMAIDVMLTRHPPAVRMTL